MTRSNDPAQFLTPHEAARVEAAVDEVEATTSAELKVVVVRHCWDDIRRKAARVFRKLGLDRTEQRSCVLIMLVTADREFLIYGDESIHAKVGLNFWDDVRDAMVARFRAGDFGEGLCEGVSLIGEKLSTHFPWTAADRDEVSDEVAYED